MSESEAQHTIYFWRPNEANGFLSNVFESQFVKDKVCFINNEQYFMWEKQQSFDPVNVSLEMRILETYDSEIIKKLGREVLNFDPKVWDEKKYQIMRDGLHAKFSQNRDLKQLLLDTENANLVYASPYDSIWGIGLNEEEAKRIPSTSWPGQNLLGIALMDVREIIRNE